MKKEEKRNKIETNWVCVRGREREQSKAEQSRELSSI